MEVNKIIYRWERAVDIRNNRELFGKMLDLYADENTHVMVGSANQKVTRDYAEIKLKKFLMSKRLKSDQEVKPAIMPDTGLLVAYAMDRELMIAACVFVKEALRKKKYTAVTLFLIAKGYENQREIVRRLLEAAWNTTNDFIVGTMNAAPEMKTLLEQITHRRVDENEIRGNQELLNEIASKYYHFSGLEKTDRTGLYFTFFHQEPEMTKEEIAAYFASADQENHAAYDEMKMDSDSMSWIKFTASEINYMQREVPLLQNFEGEKKLIYDVGCGCGRHSIQLAERSKNIRVIGIDYVQSVIDCANKARASMEYPDSVEFVCQDAEVYAGDHEEADLVLCIYDVICSSRNQENNDKIVRTVYRLCREGGYAVFSVMNYDRSARGRFLTLDQKEDFAKIYRLPISEVMGSTGDVFVKPKQIRDYENSADPDNFPPHALIDEKRQIIYRRERFDPQDQLPRVRIVCDRRYNRDTLKAVLEKSGFQVLSISPRRAGWRNSTAQVEGKELVAICRKNCNM